MLAGASGPLARRPPQAPPGKPRSALPLRPTGLGDQLEAEPVAAVALALAPHHAPGSAARGLALQIEERHAQERARLLGVVHADAHPRRRQVAREPHARAGICGGAREGCVVHDAERPLARLAARAPLATDGFGSGCFGEGHGSLLSPPAAPWPPARFGPAPR